MNKRTVIKLISGSFPAEFESKVQNLLDDGWTAHWPMQISNYGKLYLSMTKSVDIDEQLPTDETMTQQHPDAKKLGDKKK